MENETGISAIEKPSTSADLHITHEHLSITTGLLLIIDQFMLANPQFIEPAAKSVKSSDNAGMRRAAETYGGAVCTAPAGEYFVYRSASEMLLAVVPQTFDAANVVALMGQQEDFSLLRHVYVDTRCLAFVDASFLESDQTRKQFCSLRSQRQEKEARDLIRNSGGAVRYGFNTFGDELGLFEYEVDGQPLYFLWPDVAVT